MSETATLVRDEHLAALATLLGRSGLEFESLIQGSSMGSTLPHGSRIRVRTGGERDYSLGHVVACLHRTGIFAHRIVYRGQGPRLGDYVITRGDAWLVCDDPILMSDIVGAVQEVNYKNHWRPPQVAHKTIAQRWYSAFALVVVIGCLRLHPGVARTAAAMFRRLHHAAGNGSSASTAAA